MGNLTATTRRVAARATWQLALLSLLAAFTFGAVVKVALAEHYHTAGSCSSGNGEVHGSSTSDGAFHARVTFETFCPTSQKVCRTWQRTLGYGPADESYLETCNAFWNVAGYSECLTYAQVYYRNYFDDHIHLAHNWCGG